MFGKIALIVAVGAGGRDGLAVNGIGEAMRMCRGVRGHDGFIGGNRSRYGSCAILVFEAFIQCYRSIVVNGGDLHTVLHLVCIVQLNRRRLFGVRAGANAGTGAQRPDDAAGDVDFGDGIGVVALPDGGTLVAAVNRASGRHFSAGDVDRQFGVGGVGRADTRAAAGVHDTPGDIDHNFFSGCAGVAAANAHAVNAAARSGDLAAADGNGGLALGLVTAANRRSAV